MHYERRKPGEVRIFQKGWDRRCMNVWKNMFCCTPFVKVFYGRCISGFGSMSVFPVCCLGCYGLELSFRILLCSRTLRFAKFIARIYSRTPMYLENFFVRGYIFQLITITTQFFEKLLYWAIIRKARFETVVKKHQCL